MTVETYRERLTDLQLEVEELRAKLAQSTMGQLNDMAQSTKAGDTISRQAALTALTSTAGVGNRALDKIRSLPSAQPEIVRCKDCKYHDENGRRVSVRWLPCMDVRTGSNWFCGSAERREE